MNIKNITVLGSGIMGHGIAQVSAMSGYNVVLRDIEQGFLDKAMGKIKWSLDKLVSKEKITQEQSDDIYSRIKPIVDLNDAVKDAELVIEVVPEIMDLKKKVYAELDKAAGPDVVFASNTSTLPITEIASTTSRPEKLDGVCTEIMGIGKKTGVRIKGPTPLPIKKLNIVTRKSPCGSGTETYEKWEMKMHRRIISINADDKAIRQLMRLKIPDDVYIELSLT